MILIAERVGLLSDDNAKDGLLKRAYGQWSEKAVFEWRISPTPATPSLRTRGGRSLIGDVTPDQSHSVLDQLPSSHSVSPSGKYRDPGSQEGLRPEAFLILRDEVFSDLDQSALVYDSMTRRVSGTPCPNELWNLIAENEMQKQVAEDRSCMEAFNPLSEGNAMVLVRIHPSYRPALLTFLRPLQIINICPIKVSPSSTGNASTTRAWRLSRWTLGYQLFQEVLTRIQNIVSLYQHEQHPG